MGFVLSILYFVTLYLTPETVFGPLAAYRIELILALLILFLSVPKLIASPILKTPQFLALIGLMIAVFMSVLIAENWVAGGVQAFLDCMPCAFAYLFVSLHCNSKRKLHVIVLMLLFVCLFVIAHASIDEIRVASGSVTVPHDISDRDAEAAWEIEHPYLLPMEGEIGKSGFRIRGLGIIHDPNDFGQLTVTVIPLAFIFWRAKKGLQNIVFVALPVCVLLFGTYLTHSRGTLVALTAITILAVRGRIGTLPALVMAGVMFAGAMALNFTGGRNISASAGEDRTALWGEGMQALKAHPLFGVGYGQLVEYTDSHLTAHNSVVICASELGMFGLYFWSLFLFSTMRDTLAIASPAKVSEGEPIAPEEAPFPHAARAIEVVDKEEINRMGRLLVLSLAGFLVTGMFLSRAFTATLFILGGMAEAIFRMSLERGMIAPRLPLHRVLLYAFVLTISLVLMMYIMVRILNFMH